MKMETLNRSTAIIKGIAEAKERGVTLGRPRMSQGLRGMIRVLYKRLGSMNQVAKELDLSYGSVWNVVVEGLK